jgi:acetyl esterase/lipase
MNVFSNPRPAAGIFAFLCALLLCGCNPFLPSNVTVERNLKYAQIDNQSLKLDMYLPRKPVGTLPVIVWIHGGGWYSGSKDFCPIGFMAASNLAIVSINYRLAQTATFPTQLYDCKGAIRWLRANAGKYDLDTDHIGIAGVSAGGHLGLLLATTANHPELEGDVGGNLNYSSRVQCVVAFYPPTDLNRLAASPQDRTNLNNVVARLIGGPVAENVQKAIAASPLTYVDKNSAPVYLLHGGADTLVPPEQSEWFYDALKKDGVDARLVIVPGKGHGTMAPPEAAEEIHDFYNKYLKMGQEAVPAGQGGK